MSAPPKPPLWTPPSPLPGPLTTERLILRFYQPDDAPALLAALDADRASLLPWIPWAATDNRTLAECTYNIERFRRETVEAPGTNYVLGAFDRASGELCGGTGLHRIVAADSQAEIGYWIRGDRARRGLCSEATRALVSWAFTPQDRGGWGLRRIEIRCAGGNLASQRIPAKMRLRREITARDAIWVAGLGYQDQLGWGVLAHEWDLSEQERLPDD